MSKSKCTKHTMFGPLGSCDVEKMHAVVARSTFRAQNAKKLHFRTTFWALRASFCVAGARDSAPCLKCAKREGFVAFSKTRAGVGRLKRIWQRWSKMHVRGRRSTRDMFIRDVRRSGRWFPEKGCILEHQIFSFGKMILRDRCSTSYDLASLFRGRRSTLDRWSGKKTQNALVVRGRLSALNFPFLKAELLQSLDWLQKLEVSQNCFVFDVANFTDLRKSRRIASLLTLSSSKVEEVSQNSFVFKFADCS